VKDQHAKIREASSDDIPALQELIADIFEEYEMDFIAEDEIPDLLNFDSYYQHQKPILLVAERDNKPMGCAALKFDDAGGVYFSRVYVKQSERGQGIGFALMVDLLEYASQHNPTSVYLWTDTRFERAHRFYQHLGFIYTGHIRPLHDVNESFEYHYRLDSSLQELLNKLKS
jgi:N-acetylglutamate synthase-like GNAT family acetyltransferase